MPSFAARPARRKIATALADPSPDRLESWKEIAAYLRRDVTTVQRWERREGMPVHRHLHDKAGSVYGFRTELDAWTQGRKATPAIENADRGAGLARRSLAVVALGTVVVAIALIFGLPRFAQRAPENPLADARFLQLTNFGGREQAAALSRDGSFVAFLSNRDGPTGVWVTQVGTGRFYNLTPKSGAELINPSVRTLGFSPDGAFVTFWTRSGTDASTQPEISIRSAPVLGGPSRPYLEGVAEFDWSADGTRLAYHTPGPGDPLFVRDADQEAKQIFSAPAGLHGHFPVWSPDGAFIYFAQGSLPDRMDVWRISPGGGPPERITHHDSRVSHPVFLDPRTLLYLATDEAGSGPWLYSVDIHHRQPRRASFGLERYTSLAASADGRRLVATLASTKSTLWRFPIADTAVDAAAGTRISLTTGNGSAPRLGPDYLLYISSKGESDSIWKLQGDAATELWSREETRIIGAPSIARDGHRIAIATRRGAETSLYVVNADGTNARVVARSLELHGTPSWAPDGRTIIAAAIVDGAPRLFTVPLDGGSPSPFAEDYAVDPLWSPDGDTVLYSGPDIGTTFQVKAVGRTGSTPPLPDITLSRGSRHLAFMPGGRSLALLRGEMGHKNLALVDLTTGIERQLTNLSADFGLRDFDISPDGRHIVLEQVQELSDIVLIELNR
jgi:Tol biopolymer transport system component